MRKIASPLLVLLVLMFGIVPFLIANSPVATPYPYQAPSGLPGVDSFMSAVDKADRSSDRWLFIATVSILVLSHWLAIRYLLKDRELARTDHARQLGEAYTQADKARDAHAATMREMYGAQTKLAAETLVTNQENSILMADVRKFLERLSEKH